jgi:hypothetical protein
LDEWLDQIGWHLGSFCESGLFEPEDLIADIRNRDRQLWLAVDDRVRAVCLTLVNEDRLKSVSVTHCAGDGMGEWAYMLGLIQDWARAIGSKRFEVICRPGWERILKDVKKSHVILEKRL